MPDANVPHRVALSTSAGPAVFAYDPVLPMIHAALDYVVAPVASAADDTVAATVCHARWGPDY